MSVAKDIETWWAPKVGVGQANINNAHFLRVIIKTCQKASNAMNFWHILAIFNTKKPLEKA